MIGSSTIDGRSGGEGGAGARSYDGEKPGALKSLNTLCSEGSLINAGSIFFSRILISTMYFL